MQLQKGFDPIVLRFPILIIYVVQSIYKPPATAIQTLAQNDKRVNQLIEVVYMSSKILQLAVGSRDLSQAEKQIFVLLAEQIHKMTTIFT